jgi:parallel beta-helix repeat protein
MTVEVFTNYIVENNWVNGKKLGFYTNLDKATFSEPIYGQLFFINCKETMVSNQVISNASVGLSLFFCEKTTLINNTCNKNNLQGMNIWHCTETILDNNTCNNNEVGIELTLSSDATLTDNIFANNNVGIYLPYILDTSIITDNLFNENDAYGIYCFSGFNCIIYHNTFINNNLLGHPVHGYSQAYDGGGYNVWFDNTSKEGNFWSNWDGTGPYPIDGWGGGIGNLDLYPLDAEGIPYIDTTPPVIDHPSDISYEEGVTGNSITWNPEDLNPSSYEISRNGTIIISGYWSGESITISIDDLESGYYFYECKVYDLYDNSITDTVIVTVTESTTEENRFEMIIVPLTLMIVVIPLSFITRKRSRNS